MTDKSTRRSLVLAPPPCPAPVPETTLAALLRALRADLRCEVAPQGPRWALALAQRAGPAIAVLGTCTLLVTTLALYVGLCVAIFAIF